VKGGRVSRKRITPDVIRTLAIGQNKSVSFHDDLDQDKNSDVAMNTPLSSRSSFPSKQEELNIIVANKRYCMVDLVNKVVVMSREEVEETQDIDEDISEFHPKSHLKILHKWNKEGRNKGDIETFRRTEKYGTQGRQCTYLVRFSDDDEELRYTQTEIKKLFSNEEINELLRNKSPQAIKSASGGTYLRQTSDKRPSGQDAISDSEKSDSSDSDDIGNETESVADSSGNDSAAAPFESVEESYRGSNSVRHSSPTQAKPIRIIAKQTYSNKPSYCLVKKANGKREFMQWSDIQSLKDSVEIYDEDKRHGIHPKVDRSVMSSFQFDNLKEGDYEPIDAIPRIANETYYITVLLNLKGKKQEQLMKERKTQRYEYKGPVRCSQTMYKGAGGNMDILRKFLQATELGRELLAKKDAGKEFPRYRSPTPQTNRSPSPPNDLAAMFSKLMLRIEKLEKSKQT
jgi:hypothetical protein